MEAFRIERGSATRAKGGPDAGARELAQLPRSDGPERRGSQLPARLEIFNLLIHSTDQHMRALEDLVGT